MDTLRVMRRLASVPGIVLVSVAAVMWGLDGLIRKPLLLSTPATTLVFGEHVVLVACTLPLLVPALVSLWRAGPRYLAAGIAVGAGASALATILFTQAFAHGDFITVVVLQKCQPLVAVVGAWIVLGEQPRRGFAWFLVPALAGIWLIALPHPLAPHVHGLVSVAETLGAAALWGLGTVFGRYLGRKLAFEHVTTVRFAFGLVASACALPIVGVSAWAGGRQSAWIALLALVTGLFALLLYYYGLQRTPAVLATLGELAFPVTAALVGIYVFNDSLRWSQWVGVAVTVAVVSLLPVRRSQIVKLRARDRRLEPSPASA
jgi:drug/metabolite transporter, DME family